MTHLMAFLAVAFILLPVFAYARVGIAIADWLTRRKYRIKKPEPLELKRVDPEQVSREWQLRRLGNSDYAETWLRKDGHFRINKEPRYEAWRWLDKFRSPKSFWVWLCLLARPVRHD